MKRRVLGGFASILFVLFAVQSAFGNDVQRGEYLTRAAGCISCHTDGKAGGKPFAGGRGLKTPFGIYYSPNITADPETGIGGWSDPDFLNAVKRGIRPDGAHYFPVFPYTSYTQMLDADALAIKAYLFSLPTVRQKNREHDVSPPFSWRWPMMTWKLLHFDEGDFSPDKGRDDEWNRGAYLVNALAHCGECHTPRTLDGGLDWSKWMAGTEDGPDGDAAPNLTTDNKTGLGWTDEQLAFFLKTGTKPDWEEAEGVMGEAIIDGYQYLTEEDRRAIARYIGELPAIENHIGG
ncbi:MAG: cytochrome c [Rhodospirillaceae bacterium]|nr:cytochrome c [Rhodospirillaceae bacterium]MBT5190774.1 cytochrome c [Rhodospirillaceae bacterium]MBT5897731.1 cytochrome c [Rhodospirillaceae bacterium]